MLERFVKEAQAVAAAALAEAERVGARQVEAEHVLLALAGDAGGRARPALEEAGLDRAAIERELRREFAESLARVGVDLDGFRLPDPAPHPVKRWGPSAKAALEGALVAARDRGERRIEPHHILLSLLHTQHGTVARVLGDRKFALARAFDRVAA